MIMDKQQMFSEAQAITATAASANVLDMGSADAGKSQPEGLSIFAKIDEAFNNLTSLNIKLQTATDAAFSSPVDLPISATPLLAALTLNSVQLRTPLPIGCLRFLRLYYTVTGTAPSTGKITAGLVLEQQTNP
jgi:hypothetical protein